MPHSCPRKLKSGSLQASVRVDAHQDNVAGVKIPKFEKKETAGSDSKMNLTGLGSGGQQVQGTRKVLLWILSVLAIALCTSALLHQMCAVGVKDRLGACPCCYQCLGGSLQCTAVHPPTWLAACWCTK